MEYAPNSAASNAVIVRIEVPLSPGFKISGLTSKLASKGFGAVGDSSWLGQGKIGYGDGAEVIIMAESSGHCSKAPTDK